MVTYLPNPIKQHYRCGDSLLMGWDQKTWSRTFIMLGQTFSTTRCRNVIMLRTTLLVNINYIIDYSRFMTHGFKLKARRLAKPRPNSAQSHEPSVIDWFMNSWAWLNMRVFQEICNESQFKQHFRSQETSSSSNRSNLCSSCYFLFEESACGVASLEPQDLSLASHFHVRVVSLKPFSEAFFWKLMQTGPPHGINIW